MLEAHRIPVLMYHRVGEPEHGWDRYCIEPKVFRAQMALLEASGYGAIGIESFHAWLSGALDLPANAFLITFDDGFAGVHEHAAPALEALGWTATIFLVADKIGGQSDWGVTTSYPMKPSPLLKREQLVDLANRGFSLQSHSLRHFDLTTLDAHALANDLLRSREIIEKVAGNAPKFLAYPYGRYNNQTCSAARQAGFEAAFSVESGFNRQKQDPMRLRRLDVFGTDSPAQLLRKMRFGTNDGRISTAARYYARRLFGMT